MKYRVFPLSSFAPKGSKTSILIFVSFAIVLTISGLNCGSERTHVTFSCSITSLISASCSAPGKTSVLTVNAPIIFTSNLFSKYWYASWNTTTLASLLISDFTCLIRLSISFKAFLEFDL